ncbi:MAG TPA: serine/threonine-protein kinase [Pseudomonadales bacterium]
MDIQIAGYQLQQRIGTGGMADVYLATQENFDRLVAIKLLRLDACADNGFAERFLQEAKTLAGLNHPHIIPVHDVGRLAGHYYMAMEYVPGGSLADRIRSGLALRQTLEILAAMTDALAYAHEKNVIHRDIKPDNILFRENRSAVLTDFGIARRVDNDTHMTRAGMMLGTPAYMAPEQARGLAVDGRADIYALGAVFYEMLTGRPPYQAPDAMAMALAHISEPVPQLPDQLVFCQPLLDKMMAKDVAQRIGSARALAGAIAALVNALPANPQHRPASAGGKKTAGMTAGRSRPQHEAVPATVRLPDRPLEMGVQMVRRHLLRQPLLRISIVAEDAGQFSIRFGKASQQMLLWHDQYGRKARSIAMTVFCQPWMMETVSNAIRCLRDEQAVYGFLQRVNFSLQVCDLDGLVLQQGDDVV